MALAETYKAYTGTMWDKLSALATWQPDVPLAVGDVVTAGAGGVVTRETTLAKLGVPADRLPHSRHDAAPVREHSGVSINASGSAVVTTAGKARASFSKQSAFLVVTAQGWLDTADSMADVRAVVEDLHARELWGLGWHLVTSVRSYPACTIIIAKIAGAEAEVTVDLGAAALGVPEGIRAGAGVSVNSDHASHWVMSFDCTPLYEAIAMKRRGLRRRTSATQVEYLTRDRDPAGVEDDLSEEFEEEIGWTAQRSAPADLGLL
jgi:hypothetical protein